MAGAAAGRVPGQDVVRLQSVLLDRLIPTSLAYTYSASAQHSSNRGRTSLRAFVIGSTHTYILLARYQCRFIHVRSNVSPACCSRVKRRHSQSRAGTVFGSDVAGAKVLSHHSIYIWGCPQALKAWVYNTWCCSGGILTPTPFEVSVKRHLRAVTSKRASIHFRVSLRHSRKYSNSLQQHS